MGISPERFWRSTPRELELEFTAAKARRERQRQNERALVWLQAGLMRAKRLPNFFTFTGIPQEASPTAVKTQDWRQMQAMVRSLGRARSSDRPQRSQ